MATLVVVYSAVEFLDFYRQQNQLRDRFYENQKQLVHRETEKVIEYINLSRLYVEDKLNRQLYERTMDAWNLMNNLYHKFKNQKSKNEIKQIIKEALRPLRFNNGRGYYFMVSLDGTEELFPLNPEYEGHNMLNFTDDKGNYVVREELEVIKRFGEGFVSGYWKKWQTGIVNEISPKTSYIKLFEPLNLYVGCGEYLDEVQKDIQQEAIKTIRRVRFGNNGYAFAFTFDGKCVVSSNPKLMENANYWDTLDINGVPILPKMRELANSIDGGFLSYHFAKPYSDTIAPKVSYVRGIHDWEWIVGSGVYLDEIEQVIAEDHAQIFKHLFQKLILAFLVLGVLLIVIMRLIRNVATKLHINFAQFTKNLEYSVSHGVELEIKNIEIEEITQIASEINQVIRNRHEAELLLRQSESLFRVVFQNVPVILIIFDENLHPLRWNKEADSYFNFEETAKSGFSVLYKQSEIGNLKKIIFADRFNNKEGFREFLIPTKKGERYQNWAIFDTEDKKTVSVGYDIHEQKKREKQLDYLNQTKDKIFSIISHDLHGPFNAIMGFAQIYLAKHSTLSEEKKLMYVRQIHDSANNMHKQLLNILQWGRLQSGNIKISIGKVVLEPLVDEVLAILRPQAEIKRIELINIVHENIKVLADASMLFTVMQNLIANAIKFTNPGGRVEITAVTMSEFTTLTVSDNGIGMNNEQLEKIFDLKNTPRRKGTSNEMGTGLGLHLCKEFVELMEGHIWVTSEEKQGTTIFVQLPTAS